MRKIRVYLDNCCFNRPFDDQSQIRVFLETQAKLHIQNLIGITKLELAYSYMSVFENRNNPNDDNGKIIEDFFAYAAFFVDPNREEAVENRAEKIKTLGIKKMRNQNIIRSEAINCLLEKLGPLETEIFISNLLREPFDYTKWQRDHLFQDMPLHELNRNAAQYVKEHYVPKRLP